MLSNIFFITTLSLFSLALLSICIILMNRARQLADTEAHSLVSIGARIVFHSGLILGCLQYIIKILNTPTMLEKTCDLLLKNETINNFYTENCFPSLWSSAPTEIVSSALLALSWLLPFIFAATGVNIMSHGLLTNNSNEKYPDFSWCKNKIARQWFKFLSNHIR